MSDLGLKRILVFGLGATGQAVLAAGASLGAEMFACDDKAQDASVPLLSADNVLRQNFDCCVVSPGIPPAHALVRSLEERGVPVISEIELAGLVARAPIAAVTGTNGKSTTTVLAGRMIEASGRRTFIGGNLSAEGYDLPLITAAMQAAPEDAIVAEVSSFQLERCYRFRPKAAALLNITEDHLNRYATMDDYAAAKLRIFRAQTSTDFCICGLDDPGVRMRVGETAGRRLCFSAQQEVEQGAFQRGEELVLRFGGREDVICRAGEMKLWASYDRLNVLAAACVAAAMGATLEGIRAAATTFEGLPHRMEDCGLLDGVRWLNSSMCTNPAAGRAAVRAVGEKYPSIVIAGGADKGMDFQAWGEAVAGAARTLILIGQDAPVLAEAARAAGMADIRHAATLQDAMELARSLSRPGDAVILAPAMASFGEFTNFRDRGQKFRETVEQFRTEAGQ